MKNYQTRDIAGNINEGKEKESQQTSYVTILYRNPTQLFVFLFSVPAGA